MNYADDFRPLTGVAHALRTASTVASGVVDTLGYDVALVTLRRHVRSGASGVGKLGIRTVAASGTLYASGTDLGTAVTLSNTTALGTLNEVGAWISLTGLNRFLRLRLSTVTESAVNGADVYLFKGESIPASRAQFASVNVANL